jgi:hypothetical protein
MKYLLVILCIVMSYYSSTAQSKPLVEYKAGSHKFMLLLDDAYVKSLANAYDPWPDTNQQYYEVLFSIDSNGKIGDQIIVTSVGDTAKIPSMVINALRKTDGQWINHAGKTVWVEQYFCHQYVDPKKSRPPILHFGLEIYNNWKIDRPDNFVQLPPIISEGYPPVN